MKKSEVFLLSEIPVHLGLGATVIPQDRFTGAPSWYQAYGQRNASDGGEGRLVSVYTFDTSWPSWEMHPQGEELVVCLAGAMTVHQEQDGVTQTVKLGPGEAVVNPRGVWHTADVEGSATAQKNKNGIGTEHCQR